MSLSSLFLKIGKFLVLYLDYTCKALNFTTQMTLRHLLTHNHDQKSRVQRSPNIFENVEKGL